MKKNLIISLAIVAVLLTSCMGSNNAAMAVGGELTGSRSAAFNEPAPFGMVLIPRGSLKLGEEETDSLWGSNAPHKEISVESFWMDDTEITNAEYRQFVHWVRDSIIRERLADPAYGGDETSKLRKTNMVNPLPLTSIGKNLFPGVRLPRTSRLLSTACSVVTPIPVLWNSILRR